MPSGGLATCVSNVTQCFAALRALSLDLEEIMYSGAILCSQPELFKLFRGSPLCCPECCFAKLPFCV